MTLYQDHVWQPWNFVTALNIYLISDEDMENFVNFLAVKYKVECEEDWYRVPQVKFRKGIVKRHGGLESM